MARVFTGLSSFLFAVALSTPAIGDCQGCQASGGTSTCCPWNRPYTEESSPDVFYNFYQPANCGGVPAAAFPAPHPTPAHVGHQYTTYQPFMPNEWLYMHHRTYHQAYNRGMGLNITKVHWHGTPLRTDLKTIRKFFSIPR